MLHQEIVTESKIRAAIDSFAPYKACGPDGVSPVLLQKGMDLLSNSIGKLYRACLNLGVAPRSWCKARVVFYTKTWERKRILIQKPTDLLASLPSY